MTECTQIPSRECGRAHSGTPWKKGKQTRGSVTTNQGELDPNCNLSDSVTTIYNSAVQKAESKRFS